MHQAKVAGQDWQPGCPVALRGELTFASPEAQIQRAMELLGADALVVEVPALTVAYRGRLAEFVDEHVERELAARGAPSPYLAAWSALPEDAEGRLGDQIFRARSVGASGLAIQIGSLAGIARPALDPADSATLRRIAHTTEAAPLVVMLDDADAVHPAYAAPLPLAQLLAATAAEGAPSSPTLPLPLRTWTGSQPAAVPTPSPSGAVPIAQVRPLPAVVAVPPAPQPAPAPEPVTASPAAPHEEALDLDLDHMDRPEATVPMKMPTFEPTATKATDEHEEAARRRAVAGVPVARPNETWRAWALALAAARGPQPLAAFERLFVESYLPLANALADGLEEPRATRAYEEFRRAFERTYTDAFATFGATSRRPRLVMDAYDLASKQARLHNARASHVLVVDSMRYDVGMLVREALLREANGIASLTNETTLWSALPSTTFRQLETLARGVDALRAPTPEDTSDSLRGRTAETVRRLRVGSRELYKLDVLPGLLSSFAGTCSVGEALTRSTHDPLSELLDEAAEAVADALVKHLETLPPRTLVYVLGDHGFSVDRRGRVSCGGASPEEVLVPAMAWLVGDLH